jgi:hypothetical protein
LLLGALLTAGCSSAPPPTAEAPGPQSKATSTRRSAGNAPDIKQAVGALDQKEVKQTFTSLLQKVEQCQDDRRKQNDRLDFLAGDVKIEVRVNESGAASSVTLLQTTLGDRVVEKCIADAARALRWPRPQGGLEGIAGNEFSLPVKAERDAVAWGSEKADGPLARGRSALAACKAGSKGRVDVTAYVDTDGKVITAGASQPDPTKPGMADCLADATRKLTFPSPGGWPAKITFAVD